MNVDELNSKKLDELRTIGRTLGIKNLYKRKKSDLIKNILEKGKDSAILKSRKPISQRKWFYPGLFSIIAIIFTSSYFIISSNSSEADKNEIITTFQKSLQTDEEYSKYIEEQEELNNQLLKNSFGEHFQVFGQRNNHMFKNETLLKTKIVNEGEKIKLTIDAEDLILGGVFVRFSGNTYSIDRNKINTGRIFPLYGIGIGNEQFAMTMLNEDWNNPVYAIGILGYK